MHDTSLYVKGMFFIYLCNFLMMGGNCPGGNCPKDGNCPGGNCPGGNHPITIK